MEIQLARHSLLKVKADHLLEQTTVAHDKRDIVSSCDGITYCCHHDLAQRLLQCHWLLFRTTLCLRKSAVEILAITFPNLN